MLAVALQARRAFLFIELHCVEPNFYAGVH
jgi:hypothetical protein